MLLNRAVTSSTAVRWSSSINATRYATIYNARQTREQSTIGPPLTAADIEATLAKPTWSVSSLIEQDNSTPTETITQKQLYHLLRLSALPLPKSPAEEAKMIETLQSQLHFVRAIQNVNTTGIKPLKALREETAESRKVTEYTVESLQDLFSKEQSIGFARRIRKKPVTEPNRPQQEEDLVDALRLASNKVGRYIVVNTKKS